MTDRQRIQRLSASAGRCAVDRFGSAPSKLAGAKIGADPGRWRPLLSFENHFDCSRGQQARVNTSASRDNLAAMLDRGAGLRADEADERAEQQREPPSLGRDR